MRDWISNAVPPPLRAYPNDEASCEHRVWLTVHPPICNGCGKRGFSGKAAVAPPHPKREAALSAFGLRKSG